MYHNELAKIGIDVPSGRGGEHYVKCPNCASDRKKKRLKTLKVNVDRGLYVCFHCGYKGTVSGHMEYQQPKKEYAVPPPGELRKLSDKAIEWFSTRGISNQTLLRYRVSEGETYIPQVDKTRNAIHFNYYNTKGELVNIKYRDAQKNFKLFSGAQLAPYGMDVAFDSIDDYLIITEGEIDSLSWYEAGIPSNVSVPNGAPSVPKTGEYNPKLEWLDEWWQFFDSVERIYLALDNDRPGQLLRDELARRIGKEKCYIVKYPDGCKDANDVLIQYGGAVLVDCFSRAEMYPIEGIEDISSEYEELMDIFENGLPEGDRTGVESLDDLVTWHRGQVTLVTGAPGHGKTSFLKQLTWWLSKVGWKWFIYSAEEGSTALAIADIISIAADKTFLKKSFAPRVSKSEIDSLAPVVNEHYKFMKIEDTVLKVDDIIAKTKEMVKRFGIRGVIIDNMSTVENGLPRAGESRHNILGQDITKLRLMAKQLGVHVFLVAHPRKLETNKDGIIKPAGGYDVSESSHYYNLPDNGVTVYRNLRTGQTDIIFWKVRYKYTGTMGKMHMTFNPATGCFYPAIEVTEPGDTSGFVGQPRSQSYAERFSGA
jgi:twinkle protein